MLKNITLSADGNLIQKAREKARQEHKSLNVIFRGWVIRYVGGEVLSKDYQRLMAQLSHARAGRKFSREEMNDR